MRNRERLTARRGGIGRAAAACAASGVLCEIAYPLAAGSARRAVTVAAVVLLAAAAVAHAAGARGAAWAARYALTVGVGAAVAEMIGVTTGVPFGRYEYSAWLGPRLAGVPLLVPIAWIMMAYPAGVVTRRLPARVGRVAAFAVVLTAWDVYLDPQMVSAGAWRWHPARPALAGIPLTNYLGWLLVAVLLGLCLPHAGPPRPGVSDSLPVAIYAWSIASSFLANLAFFGRPLVALTGALATAAALTVVALLSRRTRASPGLA